MKPLLGAFLQNLDEKLSVVNRVIDEIENASQDLDEGPVGGSKNLVEEGWKNVIEELELENWDKALEWAEKSRSEANPSVDYLRKRARQALEKSKNFDKEKQLKKKIDEWRKSLSYFRRMRDLLESQNELGGYSRVEETIEEIKGKLSKAEKENARRKISSLGERGKERFENMKRICREGGDMEEALDEADAAEEKYKEALEIANEYNFESEEIEKIKRFLKNIDELRDQVRRGAEISKKIVEESIEDITPGDSVEIPDIDPISGDENNILVKSLFSSLISKDGGNDVDLENLLGGEIESKDILRLLSNLANNSNLEFKSYYEGSLTFDSPDDWMRIITGEQRRDKKIFSKVKNKLKDRSEDKIENRLIDFLQDDSELRKKFIYYLRQWNGSGYGSMDSKYFRETGLEDDIKVIEILSNTPVLGCIYALSILLEDGKVGIFDNSRTNSYFREYPEKLYGEKREHLEKEKREKYDFYYFKERDS